MKYGIKQLLTPLAAVILVAGAWAQTTTDREAAFQAAGNQTHCPVMGGAIDSTAYTDIQGQRVYHCCPACSASLKADPDKHFGNSAAQGVVFENIQTSCPVSGATLEEKEVFVDHQGRRVFFCCQKCIAEFEKDPAGYLTKLDKAAAGDDTEVMSHDQSMEMEHDTKRH
jgi:YHS domain-containing protein